MPAPVALTSGTVVIMGGFISMTALRVTAPATVAAAVVQYAAGHGVSAEVLPTSDAGSPDVARVTASQGGWVIVDWPRYMTGLLKGSQWLSAELDALASAVHFYDGQSWSHVVFEGGEVRDRYASDPSSMVSEWTPLAEAKRRWTGNPEVVARLFERSVADVAPYFPRHQTGWFVRFLKGSRRLGVKAFPEDHAELVDPWVFVDFWRRLGITYPETLDSPHLYSLAIQFAEPGWQALPGDTSLD
jgi:hypothetical protein